MLDDQTIHQALNNAALKMKRLYKIKAAYCKVLREDKHIKDVKDLDLDSLVDSVDKLEYCLLIKENKVSKLDFN